MLSTNVCGCLQVQRRQRARYLPFFLAAGVFITAGGGEAAGASAATVPCTVCISAGRTSPYVDPNGMVWGADYGSNGGVTYTTTKPIANTATPALYQTERDFWHPLQYQFNVPNGNYSVILKFAEIYFTQPGVRSFDIALNGQTVASNFDVVAQAGGAFTALDRQFQTTVTNGQMTILFTPVVNNPIINAIEIVGASGMPVSSVGVTVNPPSATLSPLQTQQFTASVTGSSNSGVSWSISPAVGAVSAGGLYTAPSSITSSQTVTVTATSAADSTKTASATVTVTPATLPCTVCISAGRTSPYVDPNGMVWGADYGSNGGVTYTTTKPIANTATPALYQTERDFWHPLQYQFNVPNGNYAVTLKFAEIYFTQPGVRSFNIALNGQTVASNFDVVAQAGGAFTALDRQFQTTVTNGQMTILFTPVVNNPIINAIEIVGASGMPVSSVGVTVNPPSATLSALQTQQFTASVTGSSNSGVSWSISPAVGAVSAGGLYTAPSSVASSQTVTVTATSAADSTKRASAVLNLQPVTTSVSPGNTTLRAGQTQQFTATVTGAANTGVAWSVSPAVGSISTGGLYSAPAALGSQQTVTVTATSVADTSKKATASVTVVPPVQVTVSPSTASLAPSGTQQFTAVVTGTTNTALTWSVNGTTGGNSTVGTVSNTGLYAGPASLPSPLSVTVTATSAQDPTKSATANVTVTPSVTVTVSPGTASLGTGQTQQFSATVAGSLNTSVSWSVNPAVGTISSGGLYSAPAALGTPQTVTVTATSAADPSKKATASVTVVPPVHVTVSPSTASLAPSGTQQLTAAVTGTTNTAVTWSASPAVGTISSGGLYSAPATVLSATSVTVTATSAADSTKSATAVIALTPPPLTITTSTLPGGTAGTVYSAQVAATGGTPPYVWSIGSGSWPAGLGVGASSGMISGTPSTAGSYNGALQVKDSVGQQISKTFSLVIAAALTITTASLPNGVAGTAYSATLSASGGTAPYAWAVVSGSLPPGIALAGGGTLAGTPSASDSYKFNVQVQDAAGRQAAQSFGMSVAALPVTVSPGTVTLGVGQTQQFTATVGGSLNTSVSWSVSPAVGTISSDGLYSAPATLGSPQTVTITATSGLGRTASTGTASVTVVPPVQVTVSPSTANLAPSGTQQFTAAVTGTTNTAVTWSVNGATGGNSTAGTVSNTGLYVGPASIRLRSITVTATSVQDPTKSATSNVTVTPPATVTVSPGTVSLGTGQTQQFSATVAGSLNPNVSWSMSPAVGTISRGGLYTAPATLNSPQTVTVTATSAADATNQATASVTITPPVTVSLTPTAATMLPVAGSDLYCYSRRHDNTGVTWSIAPATGTISSSGLDTALYTAPTTISSTSSVTVTATSLADTTKSGPAPIALIPPVQITTRSLPGGTAGTAYSATVAATGGVAPYAWSVPSDQLPTGTSLSTSTGTISGTPTTAGSYNSITMKVTDAAGYQATAVLAIVIAAASCTSCPGLGITTTSLPAGTVGSAYSATLAAIGGTSPYTWSISAGQLPPGLTLGSATGVISGTPSSTGSYSFTAMVTDSASPQNTASQSYTLTIASTTLVTDDFNRANGPLGANWTTAFGSMAIYNGGYAATSGGDTASFWNANTFTADQYAQATIALTDGTSQAGLLVRGSANNGYYCNVGTSPNQAYLNKVVSGTRTILASANTYVWHSGDVMRLDVYGILTPLPYQWDGDSFGDR